MDVVPVDDDRHQVVGIAVQHAEADDLARRQRDALDGELCAVRLDRDEPPVFVPCSSSGLSPDGE